MKKWTTTLLLCFFAALALTGCQRQQSTAWDNNKTASQLQHQRVNSLWGVKEEGALFASLSTEDYIPLQEEDLRAQLSDGAVPLALDTPGEPGSGLPGADQFRIPMGELAAIFRHLHFNTDDYILRTKEQLSLVETIAKHLKSHPNTYVFVEGHCDQRGPQAYNLSLGSRRANYVRSLLVERGVNPNQLHTISYGKEKPVDEHNNADAWSKNRRAEFKIFSK